MGSLYPHNQLVYNKVISLFEHTNKVAVIQATGTGKGFLASEFIATAFKGENIMVVAPNEDILINYKRNFNLGVNSKVTLILYQSLMGMYKNPTKVVQGRKSFQEYCSSLDLLILDEFHRVGAPIWGEAVGCLISSIDSRNGKILGLTATPVRYNDKSVLTNETIPLEERQKYAKARNMADSVFGGNVIQGITLEEAIFAKILPSFKYILGNYGYESEIEEAFHRCSEMKEVYGNNNKAVRNLESKLKELRALPSERDNLRNIIQSEIKGIGPNQKWIVFCSNQEQLNDITEDLGYWFDKEINDYLHTGIVDKNKLNVYTVYSNLDKKVNEDNLGKLYTESEGIHLIKCINKLNEGVHVKDVTGVIMLRQTLSPIMYLQQIGRALGAGAKSKPIIFDFMNNVELMKKVSAGQDEYVNSIMGAREKLKEFYGGESSPMLEALGFKGKPEREHMIVIKNKSVNMLNLFNSIQEILETGSSILWKEVEINILKKYYELGGARAVYDEMQRKQLSKRSKSAIDNKAKEYNLIYDMKKGKAALNTDSTLRWTPEEDDLVERYYRVNRGKDLNNIALDLHFSMLRNRKPEAIYNRYQQLLRGRKNVEQKFSREGERWTEEEVYVLLKNYELNIPIEQVCDELQRTHSAVTSKLKTLRVAPRDIKIVNWTKEEEQWLYNNYNSYSTKQLAEQLNRTESAITKKYKRLKDEVKYNKRVVNDNKRVVNDNRVSEDWTVVEKNLFDNYYGSDWDELCRVLYMKSPKQIKKKILKEFQYYGFTNPYQNDVRFKSV